MKQSHKSWQITISRRSMNIRESHQVSRRDRHTNYNSNR